jgi:hypothetical protein
MEKLNQKNLKLSIHPNTNLHYMHKLEIECQVLFLRISILNS